MNLLASRLDERRTFFETAAPRLPQEDYRDPAAIADLDALQANIDLQHKLGFVKAPLDVKKYADFSITKEAAQRLAASQ